MRKHLFGILLVVGFVVVAVRSQVNWPQPLLRNNSPISAPAVISWSGELPLIGAPNTILNTLTNGLVAFWNMNDNFPSGGNRVDCVGSHTLIDTDNNISSTVQTPKIGAACAASPHALVNDGLYSSNTDFNLGNGHEFTVSLWWKPLPIGNSTNPLIAKGPNSVTGCDWAIVADSIDGSLMLNWHSASGGNVQHYILRASSFPVNVWKHLAFGFDTNSLVMWVQWDNGPRITFAETALQWSTSPICLGNFGPTGGHVFGAAWDAVGFWNRSLTLSEVAQLNNTNSAQECPLQYEKVTPFAETGIAQVDDWQGRVYANAGGVVSATTLNAVSNFWNGCIADGLTNKLTVVNLIAPDNVFAALTPLVKGPGNDMWVNNNFANADVTTSGIAGNKVNKYAASGALGSVMFTTTDAGGAAYEVSGTGGALYGMIDGGFVNAFALFPAPAAAMVHYAWSFAAGVQVSANEPAHGFTMLSRTAANNASIYFANNTHPWASLTNNTATDSGGPSGLTQAAGMIFMNADGARLSWYADWQCSFVYWGHSLSSAQGQALYNRVVTYRNAIGGGTL